VALDPKSVSLIIPAHNEEAYIGFCLDSVLQNAAGRFHEIIVVDNASSDRTAEIARARHGVRVVQEMQKGVCFARQRGLEEATGKVLAYIDADTRLPADWASIAERTFQNRPNLVCLSGPYRYYDVFAVDCADGSLAFWVHGRWRKLHRDQASHRRSRRFRYNDRFFWGRFRSRASAPSGRRDGLPKRFFCMELWQTLLR
jgi:glycosyltransferase involved in cell wall biosynthesis